MLNDVKVLAWLAHLTAEADAEAVVDYDRVIKGLEMLTRPHMQQYHGKNGRLKDLYPERPVNRSEYCPRNWLKSARSRPSPKELICSVRPSLNDRFRLEAAGQIIELRQAENDPKETFIYVRATLVTRHRRQRRRQK